MKYIKEKEMNGFATFIAMLVMIATWGLFCWGKISLDTVLIVGMIFCIGLIIYTKR